MTNNWIQMKLQIMDGKTSSKKNPFKLWHLIDFFKFLFLCCDFYLTIHFSQSLGMIGLSEYQFIDLWLQQNIKFSCYTNVLALIYRIKESQNIVHEVECVSCKQSPIMGIRFKCKQCRKLSLCYECFCTGYKSSKHEFSHRMYEISTNVSSNQCSQIVFD